ncbi:MAG TPA: ABC transporter ATP-binding protein [Stellaceae bacterium]|nr:ABC transporter ATP-binding protein [Stellaceae bacterium]
MSDRARAPALELRGVVRTYKQAGTPLPVLCGVSLTIFPSEIAALVGPSGAGKSTLLHTAGLLERPDGGEVLLDGRSCGGMSDSERTQIRRAQLGFVYQFHHLLPEFSAIENVMLPQMIAGKSKAEARARALELLALVGLAARGDHRPARLSGGEQQRVAIVRALANGPRVLLGDEPTGNLDIHTADEVMSALVDIVRRTGLAAVIATHNLELARRMDRILSLEEGVVVERSEARARVAPGG